MITDKQRLKNIEARFSDNYTAEWEEIEWALNKGYLSERTVVEEDVNEPFFDETGFEIGDPYFEFNDKGLALLGDKDYDNGI